MWGILVRKWSNLEVVGNNVIYVQNDLLGSQISPKKKLPPQAVGEPNFWPHPFFGYPKNRFFLIFMNISMWGNEIGVFDAAESIGGVYSVVKQKFWAIICILLIFRHRD